MAGKTAIAQVLMVNAIEPENYSELIAQGKKKIEIRTYSTQYRGLLIIARRSKRGTKALAIVKMTDCRPTRWDDVEDACAESYIKLKKVRSIVGYFSWVFEANTRILNPFEICVDDKQFSQIIVTEEQCREFFKMQEML